MTVWRSAAHNEHVATWVLDAAAAALVVFTGALCLALPFWGDQALFTVYARQLAEGAVLYRDIFDVKQPGIFLFYLFGPVPARMGTPVKHG